MPSLKFSFTKILVGSFLPTIKYSIIDKEEIAAVIHKAVGMSSGPLTTKAESKKPNPAPKKFAVSAIITHKKCSFGANQADASTGGIDKH